jgi:hypothetical protein
MLISKEKIFSLRRHAAAVSMVFAGISGMTPVANASEGETTFGLPANATNSVPSDEDSSAGVSVMGLPGSTQSAADRVAGYLYLSYNSAKMSNSSITNSDYVSSFGSTSFGYPSLDFFNRIMFLGRDFSFWGRYSIGFADRDGSLSDPDAGIVDSSIEKSSLLLLSARVGALLSYERLSWIKPYAGVEIDPYLYRVNGDLSGADEQAANLNYGPVIGFHAPVFFKGTASVLAEYKLTIASHGTGQIFANSSNFTAGMGLTF